MSREEALALLKEGKNLTRVDFSVYKFTQDFVEMLADKYKGYVCGIGSFGKEKRWIVYLNLNGISDKEVIERELFKMDAVLVCL